MNSEIPESAEGPQMEASHLERLQPVDFTLTQEQYLILQHYLPKKYALIQHKNIKKGIVVASAVKLAPEETHNLSRVSGNTDDIESRTKRIRVKKVDNYLEEPQKQRKQTVSQVPSEDQFAQCHYILNRLKSHNSSFPFLTPVDENRDGAIDYFEIIKEPMDLATAQANLNNGVYNTPQEFHADISKIWQNGYAFNQKGSVVHKLTVDMQKYYKVLLKGDPYKKTVKQEKKARLEKKKTLNNEDRKSSIYGQRSYFNDSVE